MLKERPGIPHYREDVVCFESGYDDRNYPADVAYFNRELYLIFILEGRSEILLNGEHIVMEAGTLLVHGANYLTDHLFSSKDIRFITLSISEAMLTNDSYLTQTAALLLSTLRQNRQYTLLLAEDEMQEMRSQLEVLMRLLGSDHKFLFRRLQAACNALLLDIADFLSRRTPIRRHLSPKEHVLQEFYALVTRHFREEHFVAFYARELAISEQYLSRIVRTGGGAYLAGQPQSGGERCSGQTQFQRHFCFLQILPAECGRNAVGVQEKVVARGSCAGSDGRERRMSRRGGLLA